MLMHCRCGVAPEILAVQDSPQSTLLNLAGRLGDDAP